MTSAFLKKFLNAGQIERALIDVAEMARYQHAKVALTGGVAMQLYGSDRLTKDVDFLSDKLLVGLESQKAISFGGVKGLSPAPARIPVDIIVRSDDVASLYEEALLRADFVPELGIDVVSSEHLAAMKLYAGRTKDEEDLMLLLRSGLDRVKTRRIIRQHLGLYAAKDFDTRAAEADWQLERDSRKD